MAFIKRNRRPNPWIRAKVPFEGMEQDLRYWSQEWKKAREVQMRHEPTCRMCGGLGTLVDHITAVRDGGEFWDRDNWQTLCMRCHGRKTAAEVRNRRGNGGAEK
jgi:5-methylcytosine-specific restriction endonuclease McrA